VTKFIIGNMLDGRRIQTIPDVVSGSWSEVLNGSGDVSCTVPLGDPAISRLNLKNSATVKKSFLAAVEGNVVLQAGPIAGHQFSDDGELLTISADGMWSHFDDRLVLPILAGRLPSDKTTDTRYMKVSVDPDDPWPVDTSKSLQGIARAIVAQALSWPSGNVPVVLPAEIPGDQERTYKGSDLASVGERLSQLTAVDGGPDIKFVPRYTSDKLGIEWLMMIGTPDQPLLVGPIEPVFNVGLSRSSVSDFQIVVDGSNLGSQAFASGGRTSDEVLIAQSDDPTLLNAGFPLMQIVDASHSSVSESPTLQGYADELTTKGNQPLMTFSFDHDMSRIPSIGGFNVGDFAKIKVRNNAYLETKTYRSRIVARSGSEKSDKVKLTFQPTVA